MLNKIYQTVFFSSLIMGTIIACSANSWFTCWLGLEVNLMSLIPLLIIKLTPLSTETAIKYFLVQAMASLLIIFCSFLESIYILNYTQYSMSIIIIMALGMKMGLAPFHFWFPQVMKISDWVQCSLILTWQKIAPFVLMACIFNNIMIYILIMFSTITGSLGGLNQTSIKNILTYSSIIHSAWMLAICCSSLNSWLIYFLIYSFISLSLIIMLYKSKLVFIYEVNLSKWSKINKIVFFMSVLSLGGLPPFLGFLSKIIAIQAMISSMAILIIITLVSGSLVSLYFYTRMIYFMMLMEGVKLNISKNNFKQNNIFLTSMVVLGNIAAPLLVSLI